MLIYFFAKYTVIIRKWKKNDKTQPPNHPTPNPPPSNQIKKKHHYIQSKPLPVINGVMALLNWFFSWGPKKTLRILRVKTSPPIYSWTHQGDQGSCPPWSWSGHNPKAHHRSGCFYPQVFRRTFVGFFFKTSKKTVLCGFLVGERWFRYAFFVGGVLDFWIFLWRDVVFGKFLFESLKMWGFFCCFLKLSMIFKFFVSNRQTQRVKPELPHSSGHGLIFGACKVKRANLSIWKVLVKLEVFPKIWGELKIYGWFRKYWVFHPNHPLKKRVFHHKVYPFWGPTIFGT